MKPSDGELIAYIKDSLTDYEEPYVPGEWENFNKGEKNKRGLIFWTKRLSSAAAVLLIGAGLSLFIGRTSKKDAVQLTKVTKSKTSDPSDVWKTGKEVTGGSNKEFQHKEIVIAMNGPDKAKKLNTPKFHSSSSPAKEIAGQRNSDNIPDAGMDLTVLASISAIADHRIPDQAAPEDKEILSENTKITFADFLANESQSGTPDKKMPLDASNDHKWAIGLVVSPSYGHSKKLTMGYGVSMGYALSDKITLRSGISYNEMAAIESFDQPETATLSGGKNLESAEANLTGIDIPLEIKYNLSKNIYANLGVSAFAVLDQNRSNTYVEARLVERSVPTAVGTQETRTFVENHRTIENVPPAEIKNENFLGLYNFSFGYKQKISKNKALSIEPFIKVPVKEATKENLRIIATGLRLRFEM